MYLLLALSCIPLGCKHQEPNNGTKHEDPHTYSPRERSVDSVLALGGELYQGELLPFRPIERCTNDLEGGRPIICHKKAGSPDVLTEGYYKQVTRRFNYDGYCLHNDYTATLSPAIVWPGNLIYTNSLTTNLLQDLPELNPYRAPGRITLAVVNGDKDLSRTLTDYSYSEVIKQINDLIGSRREEFPADLTYSIHTVRTLAEASYHLRIPEDQLKHDDRYRAFKDISWQKNTFKAVINFSQNFFTLIHNTPEGGARLFNERMTADVLKKYVKKGSSLSYLSSVTYGRRFMAVIEETQRTYKQPEHLAQAIEHALPRGKAGGGSSSSTPTQPLRNVKIYLYLVGGKDIFTTEVSSIPTLQELNEFLIATAKGKNTRYAVPVSCTAKYLHGSMKVVSIPRRIQSSYSFTDYVPYEDNNKITLSGLRLVVHAIDKSPAAGKFPYFHEWSCQIGQVGLAYSLDGVNETRTIIHSGAKLSDPRDDLSISIPNQTLPKFGVAPKGYIRLDFQGQYTVSRRTGENFPFGTKYTKPSTRSFYRCLFLRYDTRSHKWYTDPDQIVEGDVPFHSLYQFLAEQYGRVEIRLHYHASSEGTGALQRD